MHSWCPSPAQHVAQRHNPALCRSFSFANSERAARPTGRRNKSVEKKQEGHLRSIAHGLCNFNAKQLQAVSHLLTEEHLRQVRIGMDIPPTNQGRRRQVGLIMGLLRSDLDESTLDKLSDAVHQAARYNLPYSDTQVEQQMDVWMEGLLTNDQEVVTEVYDMLQARQQDLQQLRTWVRQLQQHQQQEERQQQDQHLPQQQQQRRDSNEQLDPVPAAANGYVLQQGDATPVVVQDPEVLQLIQELNQQQPTATTPSSSSSSSRKAKGSRSPAAAARRSLRRLLQPLAVEAVQQQL